MALPGPAPKDPSRRARRNAGPQMNIVEVSPVEQPTLGDIFESGRNPMTGQPWTPASLRLWSELGEFASLGLLQDAQWSLLARAIALDDASLNGFPVHAKEARLQFSKFGIAPDDLVKMRIQFAQADEVEEKRRTSRSAADSRGAYKALRAVDGA